MITLPSNGKWQSSQNGDIFGSLIRSKNISLDKDGLLALARKAMVLYSLADESHFGTPTVIETDGTYAYVITDNGHFYVIDLTASFLSIEKTIDGSGPTFGDDSDMVIFAGKVHATGGAKLNYIAFGQGQTWHGTAPITDLSTSVPHPLCTFENKRTLLIGDGNIVRQYTESSGSYSRDTTNELILPTEFVVTSVRYRLGTVYIGTRHLYGGETLLFTWNGVGASAQQGYPCGADWIYSQAEYQSSIAVITSQGQIKRFNGGGFDVIANLPVYHTPHSWTSTAAQTSLIGRVASRGMRASGDVLYVNIDGSLNNPASIAPGKYLPEQPSGLWVLDPNVGLYHKAGYNHQSILTNAITDVASSHLIFGTAHQAQLGDAVLYDGALTGLVSGQVYFAIPDTAFSLRLALTPQDAAAGNALAVSGTLTDDICYFDRYESMGATAISSPGGLCVFGGHNIHPFFGSEVLIGGAAFDQGLAAKGVLMSLGMGRNVGSFVTPKIESEGVTDTFQRIAARFAPLRLDFDALLIKYRTRSRDGAPTRPITLTWASPTTFTVDPTLYDIRNARLGDELEIIAGSGAGYTAHITDIDEDASPFVVTIDETLPVTAADQAIAFVDNWTKLTTLDDESEDNAAGHASVSLDDGSAPDIQAKIEARGSGLAIRLLQFIQSNQQPGV